MNLSFYNSIIRKCAFSLVEMLLVVAITGILIALSFPHYVTVYEKAKADEGRQILTNIWLSQKRYYLDHNNNYASSLSQLDVDFRPSANFAAPTASNLSTALGQIVRTGSYTLTIDQSGIIACTGGSNAICQKIGF